MKPTNEAELSLSEDLRKARIPHEAQFPFVPGKKYRADFRILDTNILVEIEGGIYPFMRTRKNGQQYMGPGAHGTVTGILKDNERLNLATLGNWRVLRFTPDEVSDGRAITFIKQVLAIKE